MPELLKTMPLAQIQDYAELLESKVDQQQSKIDTLTCVINTLESNVGILEFQIAQLKRLLFGAKRERFIPQNNPQQMTLPFEVETLEEVPKTEKIEYIREKPNKKHPGRIALPDHLPVQEIILEPKEDTTGLQCIGKEVTDKLELIPAKLFIKRYIRPKYIQHSEDGLSSQGIIAELPSFAIDKGIASESLLAQVMVDKFVDHLPTYRQVARFKRSEIKIPYATITGWQSKVCELLTPLYEVLKHRVLSQGYLQADETPIAVQDKNKLGKTHKGYHWVYHSPLEQVVLFDYRPSRSREGPTELLKNFKGYLQTDGYSVYESFGKNKDITLLGCMAHARRGFEKALDYDKNKAGYAMELFQQLYTIERKAREENLSHKQRHELRLEKALPICSELGKWIATEYQNTLPKSALGKAMAYCLARWDNLIGYLHDGALEIDNNLIENAIRPVALGRKNYLFAGSHRAAQNAAMIYSFFATCKKHNVEPYAWLHYVLQVIQEYKVSKLNELLPQNFAKIHMP